MKRGFSLLTALTAIPLVSAGVVEDSLEFIFGATQEGGIFVKLGLFIILFSFLMISMKKVFPPEHKNAGIIVALVIALIAMKFMPEQWVVGLGQMIWIIALILLPYMILSIFFKDTSGKKKYVFWTLLISSYVLLIYFVSQVGRNNQLRYYLSFGNETVDDLWYAISSNEWIFYAVIPALIVLFLIIRKAKKSKEGDDSGESKSGPGWLDNWKERRHKKKMDSLEVKKQKALDKSQRKQAEKLAKKEAKLQMKLMKKQEEKGPRNITRWWRRRKFKKAAQNMAKGVKGVGKAALKGTELMGSGLNKVGAATGKAVGKGAGSLGNKIRAWNQRRKLEKQAQEEIRKDEKEQEAKEQERLAQLRRYKLEREERKREAEEIKQQETDEAWKQRAEQSRILKQKATIAEKEYEARKEQERQELEEKKKSIWQRIIRGKKDREEMIGETKEELHEIHEEEQKAQQLRARRELEKQTQEEMGEYEKEQEAKEQERLAQLRRYKLEGEERKREAKEEAERRQQEIEAERKREANARKAKEVAERKQATLEKKQSEARARQERKREAAQKKVAQRKQYPKRGPTITLSRKR